MNIKDIISIVKKNKRFQKRKIIFSIIITIILILLFLIITFNHTIFNYIYNINHYNYFNRILIVDDLIKENDYKTLKNNKHILSIDKQKVTSFVINNDEFEQIVLFPINENSIPNIIDGKGNLSKGKIICPKKFVPKANVSIDFGITTDYMIDGSKLINKPFNVIIQKRILEDSKVITSNSLKKEFTISGIYDSQKYMMDNNICFSSYEDFNEIYNFLYSDQKYNSINTSTRILIDNFKNVNSISKELKKIGYDSRPLSVLDYNNVYMILTISILTISIFLILIYIIIRFNIKRELLDKEQEITLYKSIGYSKKNIQKIYSFEYISLCFISTIIALFFSILILLIFKFFIRNIVIFQLLKIKFNILEPLIILIFGTLYPLLLTKKIINKTLNKNEIKL